MALKPNSNGHHRDYSSTYITIGFSAFFIVVQAYMVSLNQNLQNQINKLEKDLDLRVVELKKEQKYFNENFLNLREYEEFKKGQTKEYKNLDDEQLRTRNLMIDMRKTIISSTEYGKDIGNLQNGIIEVRKILNDMLPPTKTFDGILSRIDRLEALRLKGDTLTK